MTFVTGVESLLFETETWSASYISCDESIILSTLQYVLFGGNVGASLAVTAIADHKEVSDAWTLSKHVFLVDLEGVRDVDVNGQFRDGDGYALQSFWRHLRSPTLNMMLRATPHACKCGIEEVFGCWNFFIFEVDHKLEQWILMAYCKSWEYSTSLFSLRF